MTYWKVVKVFGRMISGVHLISAPYFKAHRYAKNPQKIEIQWKWLVKGQILNDTIKIAAKVR